MFRTTRRFAAPALAAALLCAAAVPVWATENLPGPAARPGEVPIGGAALVGDKVTYRPTGAPFDPPPITAASWILADAATGEVLAAKAPHYRYRPASTLKTLTAITLMPQLDPKATYRATAADVAAEGNRVGLAAGSSYTIDQLWHALLLPSANDAALALARANGGVPKTLAQMNAVAQGLQAFDTVAMTPNGLDHDGQWTSAYDMALLARRAIAMPEFVRVSHTTQFAFPDEDTPSGKRTTHLIYGQNRLLNHGYPGVIAGKTGFTTEGKRTFWVAARQGERTLIATLFRIGEPTEDASRDLLNWGFRHADQLTPIGTLVAPLTAEQMAEKGIPVVNDGAVQVSKAAIGAKTQSDNGGTPWRWLMVAALALGGAVVALRMRARQRDSRAAAQRAQRAEWSQRRSGVQDPSHERQPTP